MSLTIVSMLLAASKKPLVNDTANAIIKKSPTYLPRLPKSSRPCRLKSGLRMLPLQFCGGPHVVVDDVLHQKAVAQA